LFEIVLAHGGVDMAADAMSLATLRLAIRCGWNEGPDTLQAVSASISVLEDDPAFNAGFGSVLNADGDVEVDAATVDGPSGRYAAVGAVPNLRHPIRVATRILSDGRAALISGVGARRLADEMGEPSEDLRTDEQRLVWESRGEQLSGSPFTGRRVAASTETVGCIAFRAGRIAAGSSTGGVCGKDQGRIGDSAILGAGLWADNRVSVLCSGAGEAMIVLQLARRVAEQIHSGSSTRDAVLWGVRHAADKLAATCAVVAFDAHSSTVAAAHNGASFPIVATDGQTEWVVEAERLEAVRR
jgi:beta-aspartyl-peptidase (threonine type)